MWNVLNQSNILAVYWWLVDSKISFDIYTCHILLPSMSAVLGTRTVQHLPSLEEHAGWPRTPRSRFLVGITSIHFMKQNNQRWSKMIKAIQIMLSWAMICAFVQDSHRVKQLAQISSGGGAALTQCQTSACPHTSAAPNAWGIWAAWFVAWARCT